MYLSKELRELQEKRRLLAIKRRLQAAFKRKKKVNKELYDRS